MALRYVGLRYLYSGRPLPLRVDPRLDLSFRDLRIVQRVTDLLAISGLKKPTVSQRKLLAALGARFLVLSRTGPGTGNTHALLIHALNFRIKAYPTALLLLGSSNAVVQCQNLYGKWFSNVPPDERIQAQFLCRGTGVSGTLLETQQIRSLLAEQKGRLNKSHLIVGTAPRILDILSSQPHLLPHLDQLSFLGIDDADQQLTDKSSGSDQLLMLHRSTPTEILVDHLVSINRKPTFLQKAFVNSIDITPTLGRFILTKGWCSSEDTPETKSRQLVKVGLPEVDTSLVVPPRRIYSDVDVHGVAVYPSTEPNSYILKNLKIPDVPTGIEAVHEISSSKYQQFDAEFRKYRLSRIAAATPNGQDRTSFNTTTFAALRFFLQEVIRDDHPLLVIPDTASLDKTYTELKNAGIDTKIFSILEQPSDKYASFQHYSDSKPAEDGLNATGNHPRLLIASLHSIKGITLPRLTTLIALSIDTVANPNNLVTLASRLRTLVGISNPAKELPISIKPEEHRSVNPEQISNEFSGNVSETNLEPDEDVQEKPYQKLIIFTSKRDFQTKEALALYRTILKTGMQNLIPLNQLPTETLDDYKQDTP